MVDERETMTIDEAPKRLGIGRNQTYEAIRRNEIPFIRLGGRILIPKKRFDRWLEDGGAGTTD